MAIKFEKIKPGMTLYDVHKSKMGNTTMSTLGIWLVEVIEVDVEKRRVFASWNCNKPEWYSEFRITRFRAKYPETVTSAMGVTYLKKREKK